MLKEAAVVLSKEHSPMYWHIPDNRMAAFLPDSSQLFGYLLANKDALGAIAHTHPHFGVPIPCMTDYTTFYAVEEGLGINIEWFIVSLDKIVKVSIGEDGEAVIADYEQQHSDEWVNTPRDYTTGVLK